MTVLRLRVFDFLECLEGYCYLDGFRAGFAFQVLVWDCKPRLVASGMYLRPKPQTLSKKVQRPIIRSLIPSIPNPKSQLLKP